MLWLKRVRVIIRSDSRMQKRSNIEYVGLHMPYIYVSNQNWYDIFFESFFLMKLIT
jgi:hypothetical protein